MTKIQKQLMITSIFNKSKPINFAIVFFCTLLAFIILFSKYQEITITFPFILKQSFLFLVCYISLLTLNFIVDKNKLTQKNNYDTILYGLFILALPQSISSPEIIYANFFVLLGYRRLISLRSQIKIKQKLFDAAFWFTIAALFYFWSILFFFLIFITLLIYRDNNLKHWLIPFTGASAVFLITISLSIIYHDSFFDIFPRFPNVNYNFNNYNSPQYIIFITILFSFGAWASIFFIKNAKLKNKDLRPAFYIILFAVCIAFLILLIAEHKTGSELLFLFAPISIIVANYIEIIKEKWFKEIFLLAIVILPFIILLL